MGLTSGEPPEGSSRLSRRRRWRLAAVLLLGLVPLGLLDPYTLDLQAALEPHRWLQDLIAPVREYGGIAGEVILLLMALLLDPRRRRWFLRAAAAMAVAYVLTHGLKAAVGRLRPHEGEGALAFTAPWPWERLLEDRRKSFPSGHASSSFALSMVLARAYPHARWGFYLLASACSLTRVIEARHFPTDVFAGTLLGIASARLVLAWEQRRRGPDEPSTGW